MSIEKMREEFEAKYPIPETCEGFNGGFYFVTNIYSGKETRHPHHQKWLIWQASRAAIEVEWPDQHAYTAPDCAGAAILDCRTAFNKAVKVKS